MTSEERETLQRATAGFSDAWETVIKTVNEVCQNIIKGMMDAVTGVYGKHLTPRQRKKMRYAGQSNNWLKMHGKPMRRWRYLT